VREFFDAVEVAGLLLPDGWFGARPMENHHTLTFVASRPKRLLVELDHQLLLSFSGKPVVERTPSELVIHSYRQCVFEWLEYVNETPHVATYTEGRVRLVAPVEPG
jgi:hypothetical protein